MKNNKNGCKKLISMLEDNLDKDISVYIDDSNGRYEYKLISNDGDDNCYKCIDVLITNGEVFESDDNASLVQNSDYVVIQSIVDRNVEKLSYILSYEMYGLMTSVLLQNPNPELFMKFNSSSKGSLEEFDASCTVESGFLIHPAVNVNSRVRSRGNSIK